MRLDDVDTLLKHWTNRQAAGKKLFCFKNLKHTARHGKQAASDEDEDDGEDVNEEDQQGASESDAEMKLRLSTSLGHLWVHTGQPVGNLRVTWPVDLSFFMSQVITDLGM